MEHRLSSSKALVSLRAVRVKRIAAFGGSCMRPDSGFAAINL